MEKCTKNQVEYYEKCKFSFERNFFKDKKELMPTSFILSTEGPDNEFTYRWKVECSLPNCKLNQIKVSMIDKLVCGNTAEVKININCDDVCFEGKFDFKCFSKVQQLVTPAENITEHSKLKIDIAINYQSKSVKYSLEHYNNIINDEKFNDVKFIFGKVKISANSHRLSEASSVFKSMFESDMLEKKNGKVEITDIEPKIFKQMLYFINFSKISFDEVDDLLKLIVAADKYTLTNLVSICEKRLSESLTPENAIDVLVTADMTNAKTLKKKSMKFIFDTKRLVVNTKSYNNLTSSRPELLSELFREI